MARKKKDNSSNYATGLSSREAITLDRYFKDISKLKLITAEEEVELARRIQAGDQEAFEKLVNANLRFVISVAKQFQNQGLSLADLINEGNRGLLKAAQRFDETRGFKFISYAVWWIRQSILLALTERGRMVRVPSNIHAMIRKVLKEVDKLQQLYERQPTVAEIAESLDLPINKVADTLNLCGMDVSLDAPFSQGEDNSLLDVVKNEQTADTDSELMDESLKIDINRALSMLSEREADVIRFYFGIGREHSLTLEEIGDNLDLTRERVRQIKEKALRKLRMNSKTSVLKDYIG